MQLSMIGAAFGALLAVPTASAQELVRQHDGEVSWEGLGTAVLGVPDLTGDGVPDTLISAAYDSTAGAQAGRLMLYSGTDGSLVRDRFGNRTDRFLGGMMRRAGDVNADGWEDVLVSHMDGFSVLSGTDLRTLHRFVGLPGSVSFAGLGDVDADGHDDFAYSLPHAYPFGEVTWISGDDGSTLRTVSRGEYGDHFGSGIASLGDLDGDQVPDVAISAPRSDDGAMYGGWIGWYSGASGRLLHSITGPELALWGHALQPAGDLDGDGRQDLLVAGEDLAFVLSGANASFLVRLEGMKPCSIATAGDVDGDGRSDFLLGDTCETDGETYFGAARLYSGADGSVLAFFGHDRDAESLGHALSGIGDLDGDGRSEFLIGYPNKPFHISGSAGMARVWSLESTNRRPNIGRGLHRLR